MESIDTWSFDIFKVASCTVRRPLTAVTYTILQVIVFRINVCFLFSFVYKQTNSPIAKKTYVHDCN